MCGVETRGIDPDPTTRRRFIGLAIVVIVIVAAVVAGGLWLKDVGSDFACTADRQDAIETGQPPPDCE